MPGAGSSTVAFAVEQSYLGGVGGTPTYYNPGTNVQFQDIELSRNLLELVLPGSVEADGFLAQQIEGALAVQFVLQNNDFHRLVFNDGSNTGFTSGEVNSAEWYLGVDHLSGETERQIKGWIPVSAQVQYNGATEAISVTLTGVYGAEDRNTSITPGTITNMSTGDEVPGHGAELAIDGARVEKLQSATLQLQQIGRLIRDSNSPRPVVGVMGNVSSSVEMAAVYDGSTRYEQALGSTGASSTQDLMDSYPGTLTFDSGGSTIAEYEIGTVKPDTYSWVDLVNNESDLNEQLTYNATGVNASSAP